MLLGQDKDDAKGGMSVKPPDQATSCPPTTGRTPAPHRGARTHVGRLHLGIGQHTDPKGSVRRERRYRYASGPTPASPGRLAMPGPDITTYYPRRAGDATRPINRFFDLGGLAVLVSGRYLVRKDSTTATSAVIHDFGVGQVARTWPSSAPTPGHPSTPTSRWGTPTTSGASTAPRCAARLLKATALCVRGTDLHRALNTNQVSTFDTNSDPWTAINWAPANQFYIGDKSAAITRIVTHGSGAAAPAGRTSCWSIRRTGCTRSTPPGRISST